MKDFWLKALALVIVCGAVNWRLITAQAEDGRLTGYDIVDSVPLEYWPGIEITDRRAIEVLKTLGFKKIEDGWVCEGPNGGAIQRYYYVYFDNSYSPALFPPSKMVQSLATISGPMDTRVHDANAVQACIVGQFFRNHGVVLEWQGPPPDGAIIHPHSITMAIKQLAEGVQ